MNGRFLLDTNIIIALFAGETKIHKRVAVISEVFVPCIAVGELYFGAYKSLKIQENLTRIDKFVLNNTVLFCDSGTAKKYGGIKNRLKEKAKPIPENDIWIASLAQQYSLTLITRDKHFTIVDNFETGTFSIEIW